MEYDIIVAGAGPAGCASAILLKQAGLKVGLVDELSDQPFKVGEALPGAALRLLGRLGIPSLDALLSAEDFKPCVANVSAWGSENWAYKDALRNPEGGGWHLNRTRFDAALRRRAIELGVVLIKAKVDRVLVGEGSRFCLQLKGNASNTLYASWLIDATGRAAAIGRQMQVSRSRIDDQLAVSCWLKPAIGDVDRTTRIKAVEKGWWYTALLPSGHRVLVFCGTPTFVSPMVKDSDKLLACCNAVDLLPRELSAADIAFGPIASPAGIAKSSTVYGPNWLSVGDAALSFDPLSSQGIFFALYSGIGGAEAILNCLQNKEGEAVFLKQYQTKVSNVYMRNQQQRFYFYSSERRFLEEDFWKKRNQELYSK